MMAPSPCDPTTTISPEEEHALCRTTKKILHTARTCTIVSPHAQQGALLGEAVRHWQRPC